MKVLTLNFLTCAVKTCKSSSDSFPLHPKDAELVSDDVELNPQLLVNLLPRIDWNALRTTTTEARRPPAQDGLSFEMPLTPRSWAFPNCPSRRPAPRSSRPTRRCSRTCTRCSSKPR